MGENTVYLFVMTNIAIFIVILIVQKPKSLHFNVLNKFLRKC